MTHTKRRRAERLEHFTQCFAKLKEEIYRAFHRSLGKNAWNTARQRLLNPSEQIDFAARDSFQEVWSVESLSHPEYGHMVWELIPLAPREAAIRLLHLMAPRYGYFGGRRAFSDEARRRGRRFVAANLTA